MVHFTYMGTFLHIWVLFPTFSRFLIGYSLIDSNSSLRTLYKFDRGKNTKMKFAFFGNPLYRTF